NGANFVLLNITFGQDELLMDEVSEITDYIQDQAGMGAEVIWGYGQDSTLGDDISVTVIATGFAAKTVDHVLPVAEAQPKKLWLETEVAEVVVSKVEKPTQDVTPTPAVVNQLVEEPFLKPVEKPLEFEFDVKNNITDTTEEVEEELPPLSSVKLTLDE